MTTHGTPTGYTNGCHGEASCTNHRTGRMTCVEASIRYAGDYVYRKAVDNGTATDEREVFAKEKRKTTRVVVRTRAEAAEKEPREPRERKPRKPQVRIPVPRKKARHGTASGYKVYACRDECPEPFTCRMAANLASKLQNRARKVAA